MTPRELPGNLSWRTVFSPSVNEYRHMPGWQAFLPFRRAFGADLYYALTCGGEPRALPLPAAPPGYPDDKVSTLAILPVEG